MSRVIFILSLCFILCGCNSRFIQDKVTDSTGNNRLELVERKVSVAGASQDNHFYDFDSLVWLTNGGTLWHEHVVISQSDFQAGSPRRRWIDGIHSLDATNGIAIIKVAEGDVPEGSPNIQYIYSWREWNLLTNGEGNQYFSNTFVQVRI